VRSESKDPASEVPGFAAMNHTTRLRETQAGNAESEDYMANGFEIGQSGKNTETLSEE
jgi:hypothetical protein